ncbi:MAG: putative LPS assembly protein LptD, partial [Bacteroidia bacterium]
FQSSLNYSRGLWQNKANLSVSARHSQNTQTRDFTVELPNVNFGVSSLTPFASKTGSNRKWYQQLRLSYNANLGNQLKSKDSLIFSPQFRDALQDLRSGMKHRIPISTNIKLFNGIVNLTPSANYQEIWYQKRLIRYYEPLSKAVESRDSLGFFRLYNYDVNASLQTNIYGTFTNLHWGNIRAIRHTLAPSVSFGYRPDTDPFAKGWKDRYRDSSGKAIEYNPFQNGIYGSLSSSSGGFVNFGLSNNLQAKKATGSDSTGKDITEKVNLIDQFNLNSGYNILADSLNWDDLRLTFNTVLFKQLRIGASASYTPYAMANGRTINAWQWHDQGQLLRFRNAGISLNTRLDPKLFQKLAKGTTEASSEFQNPVLGAPETAGSATEAERAMIEREPWNYYDFNIPWSINFTYLVAYNNEAVLESQRLGNHRLTLSGDLSITPEWKIAYNTGYDFKNMRMAGSQFSVVRSLHCWQMEFSWIPDGYRKSWTFTLRPKSALLQDLKLNKRESFYAPFAQ